MGLDVYVAWDDMSPLDEQIRYTGFHSSPGVGYLRESWGSLSWVMDMARVLDAPEPYYTVYPDWNGSNDGEIDVTPAKLLELLAIRDGVFKPWVVGLTPDGRSKWDEWREKVERYMEEEGVENVEGDMLTDTVTRWIQQFRTRIYNWISFINFVELKSREGVSGLQIQYY